MKKIVIFLFVVFMLPNYYVFAQNNDVVQFNSKTEAISVIEANYLFRYFKNPNDTIANIDHFVNNVNKVVAIDSVNRIRFSTLIFFAIEQETEKMSLNHLLGLMPMNGEPNIIPVMGININDIVKNNFSSSDYKKIYNSLLNDRLITNDAYNYLARIYSEEIYFNGGKISRSYAYPTLLLNKMFDDYNIFTEANKSIEEENKIKPLSYKRLKEFKRDTIAYLNYNFIENKQKYYGKNFIDFFRDINLPVSYVLSYGWKTIDGIALYFVKKETMLSKKNITKCAILVIDFQGITDDTIEFKQQNTVEEIFSEQQIKYLQKRTISDIRMYVSTRVSGEWKKSE